MIASVGRAEVECARRPRVAVLTTGDELQPPGEPLAPGGIRNSNAHSPSPGSPCARGPSSPAPGSSVTTPRPPTRRSPGRSMPTSSRVSGGVSVGEHDHVRPALAELGVEQVFWRVALRPGGPTYFGVEHTPATSSASPPGVPGPPKLVFGLPGNPVSAMVTFLLFVRPAIRAMLGAVDEPRRATAVLDAEYPALGERTQMVRCRLELRDDGWHAIPDQAAGFPRAHVDARRRRARRDPAVRPPASGGHPGRVRAAALGRWCGPR